MIGWIGKIFGMFSGIPAKLGLIVTLVTTVTTFAVWGYNNVYESGYNEAALQYETQMAKKVSEELNKAKTTWQVEAEKAIAAAKAEREVVEVTKTVYRDVYKTKFVCKDLGENALELLNRAFNDEVDDDKTN
tara:strand:- start:22650 stop:23045 length:396 start_codon:yes stop_codon:yes gene_type:complete